ncbi:MAG: L-aspartate oxidase [Thiotrichales bacterium]|nr:MAG: L-aspartate oxidase [Thiotrichales bacterium]
MQHTFDILIIGGGAAGLSAALQLADKFTVAVLSKENLQESATLYAQGGIAVVWNDADSIESHMKDTMQVGCGLCHADVVEFTVSNAKSCIQKLIDFGVNFTKYSDDSSYHLHKEGGHSHRRIMHVKDATGKSVQTVLVEKAQRHANIKIFQKCIAIDFLVEDGVVHGAYAYDKNTETVIQFSSKACILATGGASRTYLYSTNPAVSSGDGIAMAYRAGCRIANLEFNQFHPTCLYHPKSDIKANHFLLSEAMRGEGAYLLHPESHERFMLNIHPKAEVAPRDIVARSIDFIMKQDGLDYVYLDISHKPAEFIKQSFPNIYKVCMTYGIDITTQKIPAVPAAHYTCGGVMVNKKAMTDIENLYAIGEVSFTGLHGANRMASNSLLECLVYARAAATHISQTVSKSSKPKKLSVRFEMSNNLPDQEKILITHSWHEVRQLMWDYVGIVRSSKRLEKAAKRISLLQQEVREYYKNNRMSLELLELRNLIQVAELIIKSASLRKESRGLHYNIDYPDLDNSMQHDTILSSC